MTSDAPATEREGGEDDDDGRGGGRESLASQATDSVDRNVETEVGVAPRLRSKPLPAVQTSWGRLTIEDDVEQTSLQCDRSLGSVFRRDTLNPHWFRLHYSSSALLALLVMCLSTASPIVRLRSLTMGL